MAEAGSHEEEIIHLIDTHVSEAAEEEKIEFIQTSSLNETAMQLSFSVRCDFFKMDIRYFVDSMRRVYGQPFKVVYADPPWKVNIPNIRYKTYDPEQILTNIQWDVLLP